MNCTLFFTVYYFSAFAYKTFRRVYDFEGRILIEIWHKWHEFELPLDMTPPRWLHVCMRVALANSEIVLSTGGLAIGRVNCSASGGDLRKLVTSRWDSLQITNEANR